MQTIIQRVTEARVTIEGAIVGQIGGGLVALVAVGADDDERDIEWTANKLVSLRIFRNGDKHFDQDIVQVGGSILIISNFTVCADARKGRRPSFDRAAPPAIGEKLFDRLVETVRAKGIRVETGRFGANMQVSLTNEGPATFFLDSAVTIQPR